MKNELIISEKTKEFIALVKHLIERGQLRNYRDLVKKLNWNLSVMSEVMNGKKNLPKHIPGLLNSFLAERGIDGLKHSSETVERQRLLVDRMELSIDLLMQQLAEMKSNCHLLRKDMDEAFGPKIAPIEKQVLSDEQRAALLNNLYKSLHKRNP